MKTLIIFFLSIAAVFAQNREAIQETFQWNILNGSSTSTMNAYLSTIHPSNPQSVLDYFKSDKFILGWHWGGEINYELGITNYEIIWLCSLDEALFFSSKSKITGY